MFCRKCGNKLEDDWIVCPNCGEPQKQGDIQQTSQGASSKKWWIVAGTAVVSLVLIMIFLGMLLILGSQDTENTDASEIVRTVSEENGKEAEPEVTETAVPKKKSKKKAASSKKAENGADAETAAQNTCQRKKSGAKMPASF